jgi:DNA polymerase II small subunit
MQESQTKRKDLVGLFLKKGVLLSQDLLEHLDNEKAVSEIRNLLGQISSSGITVLDEKSKAFLARNKEPLLNWPEMEKLKTLSERKQTKEHHELFSRILENVPNERPNEMPGVKVVFTYGGIPKKREPQDFVDYYNARFKNIENILRQRNELRNTISINRLLQKRDREQISVIGMVRSKQQTKNGNCMLVVEDQTGHIKVIINKTKPDLFNMAKDIVLDEVLGVSGVNGENIIFANSIFFPDIPATKELKKTHEEVYALFLSDLHVGSKYFLEEDFQKFLSWLNQDMGNEAQRHTASKVKYVFVLGDLVDGCGVYPDQEKELTIKDIKDQYRKCSELLRKIPKHINIVICPGNHDAMRVAEPQLPIYKDFSEPLYNLPNAIIVSNPSIVNIHSDENFPGFDILIYHGYSFDFYVAEVENIRNKGGYDRADLIMKFLLQKRHLAPTHTSTLFVPDTDTDSLVIQKPPDFFVSGHIHKAAAANYRNITLLSGSCWQSKTSFQEKVGHNPEPSRVPIVNLQTRHVRMLKFGK